MNNFIRRESVENCPICYAPGRYIIRDVKDSIFYSRGVWNFRQCGNDSCNHLWLDPRPVAEDIKWYYVDYYTHVESSNRFFESFEYQSLFQKFYKYCKMAHWRRRYGYRKLSVPIYASLLSMLFYLWYRRTVNVDLDVRFLKYLPSGNLLDVGCGNGEWLEFMNALGWSGIGIDIDERAVDYARYRGIDVFKGDLMDAKFPEGTFDAITMSHVIEHLYSTDDYFRECKRILKVGGSLIISTPNNESFGFDYYKEDWRGLEPPRHLHIFSSMSMFKALKKAGFKKIKINGIQAPQILYASQCIKKGNLMDMGYSKLGVCDAITVKLLSFIEAILMIYRRNFGGVLLAEAIKL